MKGWPKKARINSRWWEIRYVPKTHPVLQEEDDYNLGICDTLTKTIYIEDGQCPESMKDTLVHELMHAHFSTSPFLPMKGEEEEEAAVLWATEAFFQIERNLKSFWGEG